MNLSCVRAKMAWASAAIMSVVLGGLGVVLTLLFGMGVRESLDKLLVDDIEKIERSLYIESSGKVDLLGPSGRHQESSFVIFSSVGNILLKGGPVANALLQPHMAPLDASRDVTINDEQYRIRSRLTSKPPQVGATYLGVQVARPLAPYQRNQRELVELMLWLSPVLILLVAVLSWFATSCSLQPLRRMIEKVQGMDAQRLHPRLPVYGNDEVGELARTFNGFFERLENSFNALRRFTADASHELRTPLSVLRTQMEVALSRERTASEYRLALESALEDLARLQHLCELLLELARRDAGAIPMQLAETNLSDLVDAWVERFLPVAEDKNIRVSTRIQEDIILPADRRLLEMVIVNLLDNALGYTPSGGKIEVSLQVQGEVLISIQDTGPGIPEADRERIFERFVRLSGTRMTASGAGLGLAIVKWVVEAHHGKVHVKPAGIQGSKFIVSLPAPTKCVRPTDSTHPDLAIEFRNAV